jgi:hypothetical protein
MRVRNWFRNRPGVPKICRVFIEFLSLRLDA